MPGLSFQGLVFHSRNEYSIDQDAFNYSPSLEDPSSSNSMLMQALDILNVPKSGKKRRIAPKAPKTCPFCPMMSFGTIEELNDHFNELHGGNMGEERQEWDLMDAPGTSQQGVEGEMVMPSMYGEDIEAWKVGELAF